MFFFIMKYLSLSKSMFKPRDVGSHRRVSLITQETSLHLCDIFITFASDVYPQIIKWKQIYMYIFIFLIVQGNDYSWLIVSKIKVFVYKIYVCTVYIYYAYIKIHTCMYIFKIFFYISILNICICNVNYMNININFTLDINTSKYFQNISCMCVFIYT